MASTKEELIRAKAHEIWLAEGCPEGEEKRHWDMAVAAVEAEPEMTAPEPEPETAEPEAPVVAEAPAPKKRAPRARKAAPV